MFMQRDVLGSHRLFQAVGVVKSCVPVYVRYAGAGVPHRNGYLGTYLLCFN